MSSMQQLQAAGQREVIVDENHTVFSLAAVMNAIEETCDETQWFANAKTGAVEAYTNPSLTGIEYEEGAFEGEGWLSLPGNYERDDWRGMCDFAYELGGPEGDELLDAIYGRGAFRAFLRCVEDTGVLQSWYAYKNERIFRMAVAWLDSHGFAWKDDRHENGKRDWRELLPAALRTQIELSVLDCQLSVCKLDALPESLPEKGFCSIVRTDEEVSLVCETEATPASAIAREDGWRAFKVAGPLDFELVGILAKISSALAEAEVPLFAISTFDTDYVLVKENKLETAIDALHYARCKVIE